MSAHRYRGLTCGLSSAPVGLSHLCLCFGTASFEKLQWVVFRRAAYERRAGSSGCEDVHRTAEALPSEATDTATGN